MARKIKIGIDVGGTFTHAVAVDGVTLELIGKTMVPTTHTAKEGVAKGVVESMRHLLSRAKIRPDEVMLIAHSTTQATNALLEGDVSSVGIIGMGKGVEGWRAKNQTNLTGIELAPGKFLKTFHRFLDTSNGVADDHIKRAVEDLLKEGAQVFVASEAFGVDHPENEQRVVSIIREMGYLATAASEISQLYGLRVRTRTAVINASMMPKMLETAELTERSVRESGIKAPVMIMRSDGGIMDINEMRRRPILTMLSGPAAGVTAALMYVKISDGIFLEVGGTSTDISVIKNGKPMVCSAEVGGHKLYVRTLDIRTVGIAGGSIPRIHGKRIVDVGPRSAHIAGLRYVSFVEPRECVKPSLHVIQPKRGDPSDYLSICVKGESTPSLAFTPTEASNLLGLVKQYAKANPESLDKISSWLAEELNTTPDKLATDVLEVSVKKIRDVVEQFIFEYKLDPRSITLVGGGGGAEALVPFTARKTDMEYWIAENAEVISAIGVALGMIRDTVERSVVNPTEADLLKIRSEAMQSIIRMGAAPDSIEVRVEVDPKQKRVIATASGTPEMRTRVLHEAILKPEELMAIAAKSCGATNGEVTCMGETEFLKVFQVTKVNSKLFGLSRSRSNAARVIDREGIIRLKLNDCVVRTSDVSALPTMLGQLIDEFTVFSDAGGLFPDVFVVLSGRIIDLSGLVSKDHIQSLLRVETESFSGDEPAIALVAKKQF